MLIWNLAESEVGLITANIVCMGPLFSKITGGAQGLRKDYTSRASKLDPQDSSLEPINISRSSIKGFRRMASDDQSLNQAAMRPDSTDRDLTFAECIAMDQVVVKGNGKV